MAANTLPQQKRAAEAKAADLCLLLEANGTDWRVEACRHGAGFALKLYDSDGNYIPCCSIPLDTPAKAISAMELMWRRAFDLGRLDGKRGLGEQLCRLIGAVPAPREEAN